MVHRADRRSASGGGCHRYLPDLYADERACQSVWNRRQQSDFPYARQRRTEKDQCSGGFLVMGIRQRHACVFADLSPVWTAVSHVSWCGCRYAPIRTGLFALDGRDRWIADRTEYGLGEFCSGTGRRTDFKYRFVPRRCAEHGDGPDIHVSDENGRCGRSAFYLPFQYRIFDFPADPCSAASQGLSCGDPAIS